MQALDGGLGDYTQWVHSACPHWTYYQNKSKTPADDSAHRNSAGRVFITRQLRASPLDGMLLRHSAAPRIAVQPKAPSSLGSSAHRHSTGRSFVTRSLCAP